MSAFTDEPRHAEDLHAWHILRPLLDTGDYLPWGTGALRPAGMVRVCNEIVFAAPGSIVECGSGISTVVLARLLRQRGTGRLVALEHDGRWAELVQQQLHRESLTEWARVVHAPLTGDPIWYDRSALTALPDVVDLLIVDGPPADKPGLKLRRAPALPAIADRLADTATVVLDDIVRPGERAVLATWEADTDWRFEIDDAAGVAFGHRG